MHILNIAELIAFFATMDFYTVWMDWHSYGVLGFYFYFICARLLFFCPDRPGCLNRLLFPWPCVWKRNVRLLLLAIFNFEDIKHFPIHETEWFSFTFWLFFYCIIKCWFAPNWNKSPATLFNCCPIARGLSLSEKGQTDQDRQIKTDRLTDIL